VHQLVDGLVACQWHLEILSHVLPQYLLVLLLGTVQLDHHGTVGCATLLGLVLVEKIPLKFQKPQLQLWHVPGLWRHFSQGRQGRHQLRLCQCWHGSQEWHPKRGFDHQDKGYLEQR
jgi:hypothetical protein